MTTARTSKAKAAARPATSSRNAGGRSAGVLRLAKVLPLERLHQPLASRGVFLRRMAASLGLAMSVIGVSLAGGMAGYHALGPMPWIDAFENAAMILSGMGPLDQMHSSGGKLFAGLYALYSGLLLVATASLILGPVLHRFLHQLHIAEEDED